MCDETFGPANFLLSHILPRLSPAPGQIYLNGILIRIILAGGVGIGKKRRRNTQRKLRVGANIWRLSCLFPFINFGEKTNDARIALNLFNHTVPVSVALLDARFVRIPHNWDAFCIFCAEQAKFNCIVMWHGQTASSTKLSVQRYCDNSNDDDDWCALPIEVRVWAFHKNTCALHLQTYTVHTLCASMLFEKDKCQFYTQRRTDTCIWSTPIILSRVTFDLCVALIITYCRRTWVR